MISTASIIVPNELRTVLMLISRWSHIVMSSITTPNSPYSTITAICRGKCIFHSRLSSFCQISRIKTIRTPLSPIYVVANVYFPRDSPPFASYLASKLSVLLHHVYMSWQMYISQGTLLPPLLIFYHYSTYFSITIIGCS